MMKRRQKRLLVLLQYKKRKITKGLLDYSDLILKAKELLFKSGAAAWVLYKLDGGIEHILVDEAQDTSAEQWDIVRALSDEFFAGEGASPFERTIFAVGDKKQSIYSFQGANPAKFALNKSYFEGQLERVGKTLKTVPLSVSFRSTNAVLSLVNNLLSNSEVKAGVLDENEGGEHIAFRDEAGGRVELWPSTKAEEDDTSEPWLPPIDRVKTKSAQDRLAAKIADKILAMIKGDILESEGRKIEPQDIMVLLRKRGSFFEKLVRELKTRNVPVTGIDRMKIKEQIAVMDLIALGDFLLLPEDDLNLAGLLRSPLFGFDEDEIYDVCFGREDATVWDRLRTKAEGKNGKEKYKKTVATLTDAKNASLGEVAHFDFYRLKNPDEVVEIGFEEALLSGVCLIEWAEKIGGYMPRDYLGIHLQNAEGDEGARNVELKAYGSGWQDRLAAPELSERQAL